MTPSGDVPNLFAWGRDGVPIEIEHIIQAEDLNARLDLGEPKPRGPQTIGFAALGVEVMAERMRERLQDQRDGGKVEHWPKVPHEIRTWCAALHAYCAKFARPAPPALLRLTFDVLGLREGQPAPEVLEAIGGPAGVENVGGFQVAAALDGEADARGERLPLATLARETGVDRRTLRRWREHPLYARARKTAAWAATPEEKRPNRWKDAIARVNSERGGHGRS